MCLLLSRAAQINTQSPVSFGENPQKFSVSLLVQHWGLREQTEGKIAWLYLCLQLRVGLKMRNAGKLCVYECLGEHMFYLLVLSVWAKTSQNI